MGPLLMFRTEVAQGGPRPLRGHLPPRPDVLVGTQEAQGSETSLAWPLWGASVRVHAGGRAEEWVQGPLATGASQLSAAHPSPPPALPPGV